MTDKFLSYFPGHAIGFLLIIQYFGSSGKLLNTGFNHTFFLQALVSLISILFLFKIDIEKSIKITIFILLFGLMSLGHYFLALNAIGGDFSFIHIFYYTKFGFYGYVFLLIFFYFKGHNFLTITKYLKFIVIVLFFELAIYSVFKFFGLSFSILFESVDGRFAGIFLHHNTLLALFSLYVMSYALFFDSRKEKYIFLIIGILLILSTGERSSLIGLLFLIISYLVFWSKDKKDLIRRINLIVLLSIFFLFFIVVYSNYYRDMSFESFEMFFRPVIMRIYFSYLSIVHVFDQSLVGFGPFSYLLPTNISDMYAPEVKEFVKIIEVLFGYGEASHVNSYHDSSNLESPSRAINSHNTFLLIFYYFGFISIFAYTYLSYLILRYYKYLRLNHRAIKRRINLIKNGFLERNDEKFSLLPIVSLMFLFASTPALLFLSLDGYLLLIVIALGYIGSFFNGRSDA